MSDSEFACEQCSKVFGSRRNLSLHVRRNHGPNIQILRCDHCSFKTKFKNALKRHVVLHSKPRRKTVANQTELHSCVLCQQFKCEVRNAMIEHYVGVHKIRLTTKSLSFKSFQDFENWKSDVEAADVCRYTFSTGKKERKDVEVRYYRCFRDGIFHSEGKGERRLKSGGSIKIGGICPASMKAVIKKETGDVHVTFIPDHVGHDEDLKHLNLTKAEKAEIARKLAQNIPCRVILDQINTSKGSELQRIHLTTRKDIANIRASFKLGKVDTDDRASVEAWIETMQKEHGTKRTSEPAEENDNSNDLDIISTNDNVSAEEIVIDEMSRKDVMGVSKNNLSNKISEIRDKFEEILENLKTDEHADILWNTLLTVIPTFNAASSTEDCDFVPASNQKSQCSSHPEKFSALLTQMLSRQKPHYIIKKPTDEERRNITAALLQTDFTESQETVVEHCMCE